MKEEWKAPALEVFDVSQTMKWHGGGGDGDKPDEPGYDEFGS